MARYYVEGKMFEPVEAASHAEAVKAFADMIARNEYGSKGYSPHQTVDSRSESGTTVNYWAFVGRDVDSNACQGVDWYLPVRRL